MRNHKTTWILLADGAHAKIFERQGGAILATNVDYVQDHRPSKELGTDRPGRGFSSGGVTHHAYEAKTDMHQYQKQLFVKKIGEILEEKSQEGCFDNLVVIAPPKTLGDLRAVLNKKVLGVIAAEIPKDLTTIPASDLPKRLLEEINALPTLI